MRALFFALLLAAGSAAAGADSFSFQLAEVRFPDFVRLIYSDVLQRSYVLESDTLKNEDVITVHVKNKTAAQVAGYLGALLDSRGLAAVTRFGVDVIGKKPEQEKDEAKEEKTVYVYRPRFRSVAYLQELAAVLFPRGSFAGQRQISQMVHPDSGMGGANVARTSMNSAMPRDAAGSGKNPAAAPVVDSGQSAYSMVDKNTQDVIVFHGTEKEGTQLLSLLEKLDVIGAELQVKAVVYEVRRTQKEGSAVSLAASILSGKLGISIDGAPAAGNAVKLKFNNLEAVYSALSSDSRFKLVSAPTMRVKSGASARFVAGSEVPILGALSYPSSGPAVQAVQYKQSGVILDIKPQVREDVTDLTIFQQISSFVATTTGVNQSPTLLKRELQTQVSAKADDMVVLGGLEETHDIDEEQGLSFLPKFLRASGEDKQRTEIMIVLHVERI